MIIPTFDTQFTDSGHRTPISLPECTASFHGHRPITLPATLSACGGDDDRRCPLVLPLCPSQKKREKQKRGNFVRKLVPSVHQPVAIGTWVTPPKKSPTPFQHMPILPLVDPDPPRRRHLFSLSMNS